MIEKLIELLEQVDGESGFRLLGYHDARRIADHMMQNGVTIPVRCKDCKHYKSYGKGLDGFESFGKCLYINMDVDMPVGGYCCYGERRADNATD